MRDNNAYMYVAMEKYLFFSEGREKMLSIHSVVKIDYNCMLWFMYVAATGNLY